MSSRTRIKICGITRLEDGVAAERAGVDSIGFVFVPASKRCIDAEAAQRISAALPPFVQRVGLFLNAAEEQVRQVLEVLPDLTLQFHGQETPDYCERFERPYIKSVGQGESHARLADYKSARAFLFDSNAPGELGGTGHVFDWNELGSGHPAPRILAGGLTVDNVASAVAAVNPYAVDVSSGVELSKGIKDADAMFAFIKAVQAADAALPADTQRH